MDRARLAYEELISVADAAKLIDEPEVVIFDCRFSLSDTGAGRSQWEESHIPGAVYAHLDDDLSGKVVVGKTGRHPLPELASFVEFLSQSGVSNASQVIAYDDSGGPYAARLWWLLKYVGHARVAVLDGGWSAWRGAGLQVTADAVDPAGASFVPSVDPSMVVTAEGVKRAVADGESLIDARAASRYAGVEEPIDPVAGHIPGAQSFPFKDNLKPDGTFKSPEELRSRFGELRDGSSVISYCGSGVTAAHNALAMSVAGLPIPKLYVGSWSDWITDPSRPVETAG